MHVLPGWVTFALLSLLSFITVDIGLRRQQAVIASLGVAGAFLPLLMSSMSGPGFNLTPPAMLGYFAVVNAVVFILSTARGWSGLVLMALVLTSMTWVMHTKGIAWGFPIQLGLSALFMALGMAPVVRLARSPTPVRGVDLAVVAVAPMLLLVGTFSYFAARKGVSTGGLLAALGLVNLIAALWVDARRSERDLWRPLTAAATVFLAASLERLLANEYLSLAWCVEGAALVWLGIAPRAGWIRGLGYGLSSLALIRLMYMPTSYDPSAGGGIGIFNGTALRDLLCIAAFLAISDRIGRKRESLSESERHAPGIWLVAANALIMAWCYREAPYVARWIAGPGAAGSIASPGQPPIAPTFRAVDLTVVVGLAWIVHSASLVFLAPSRRAPILRHFGYVVGVIGCVPLLIAVIRGHYWRQGDLPVLYPAGLLTLFCVAALVAMAAFLWSRRTTLGGNERRAPEIALVVANLALFLWFACEAGHIASAIGSDAKLTYPVMALLWSGHAAVLVFLASARRMPILRYVGYLIGAITFLIATFDEPFWREGDLPVLYPAGLIALFCVAAFVAMAAFLWSRRSTLGENERRSPEIAMIAANVALLLWTAREAGHMAFAITPSATLTGSSGDSTAMLAAGITSAAWILQAGVLLAVGWVRDSAFLRWMGLGLVGLTLSKFVLFDLQRVDVFWRFVIALGVGAVLLVFSFIYQQRSRSEKAVD